MIHILQSVSNMDRGGIESMLMNYYRHLDRTRFQFDFLVNKKKPGFFDDEIRALGGRIFQSPGVAPQNYPAYLRSMQQLLAQHPEIKVLHAHNEAMQLFALEGAKKAGLPVRIAHAHNTRLPKDAKLPIKWFCKQFIPGAATDYWACGREAGIYYFGQQAWEARGVTLRNAIDLERFGYRPQVRAKLRAEYGLNGKLVVGCVARFMVQKNHTRLLDIFAALKKVRPDSCLLLVGEGELRAELEAKAARLGIAQDVKFLGVQSDTSVWYQAMDVFVMPSLFEGLPVVGMEAQASGLPCVFSTGVTEEVLLRPDSCRISLEQPDEAWAAVLKDADRNLPDRAQAAVGIYAMRRKWFKSLVMNITYLPILNPEIVTGVSMLLLFVSFGNGIQKFNNWIGGTALSFLQLPEMQLGFVTLIIAHVTFCTPYVILNVLPKLRQMDRFTFEAAQDLGCSPKLAFYKVVIPEIMPGMVSGFLMAFTYSLDDFVISYFVSSASSQTLPVTIFSMVRKRVSPEINALTAIIFVVVLALLLLSNYYSARKEKQMMRKEEPAA